MTDRCVACGMPMEKDLDHAQANRDLDYCRHCEQPDGTMQSYEQKLESLTTFMIETQGIDEVAAKSAVAGMLAELPAWAGRR